jgi:hypothetical protein
VIAGIIYAFPPANDLSFGIVYEYEATGPQVNSIVQPIRAELPFKKQYEKSFPLTTGVALLFPDVTESKPVSVYIAKFVKECARR